MPLAMHNSLTSTRRNSLFCTFSAWIASNLERHRTIRTLKACSQRDLRDVGIIANDILDLERSSAADAVDTLCRKAKLRAGNW